jgi:hypothetical protein
MATYHYVKIVNASRLAQEIQASGITIALDHISTTPSGSDVVFKATLSASEEDTLLNLVEDHDPADLVSYEQVLLYAPSPATGNVEPVWKDPIAGDGKKRVLASHKPIIPGKESYNYFTSAGDLGLVVGSGTRLAITTASGVEFSYVDVHFSTDVNPSENIYIFGGGISWENAGWGDEISLELRTSPTSVVPAAVASGLNLPVDYNLVGTRIRYAGPGQGTHALGGYPKWVPNFNKTGYWDLDKVAMKALPNASGTGTFDWYTDDQFVGHYLHNLQVYKNNSQPIIIDATESAPLPYGMYVRLVAHNVSNTVWRAWAFMKMYRERLK